MGASHVQPAKVPLPHSEQLGFRSPPSGDRRPSAAVAAVENPGELLKSGDDGGGAIDEVENVVKSREVGHLEEEGERKVDGGLEEKDGILEVQEEREVVEEELGKEKRRGKEWGKVEEGAREEGVGREKEEGNVEEEMRTEKGGRRRGRKKQGEKGEEVVDSEDEEEEVRKVEVREVVEEKVERKEGKSSKREERRQRQASHHPQKCLQPDLQFNHPPTRRKNKISSVNTAMENGDKKIPEKAGKSPCKISSVNTTMKNGDRKIPKKAGKLQCEISSVNATMENGDKKIPKKAGKLQCKYYLSPGGCKLGTACRYAHHQERIVSNSIELNFMGLPLRHGERDCPFYMRTGSCKFSTNCRFHHPDPTEVDKGGGQPSGHDRGSPHSPGSGASQPFSASWHFQRTSNSSVPSVDASPPYLPASYETPNPSHSWMEHLSPVSPNRPPHVHDPAKDSYGRYRYEHRGPVQTTEFPQRSCQPDGPYDMRNEDCKYSPTCEFHHPKSQFLNPPTCHLSPMGLPLRPGQPICKHYKRHGLCKFGPTCAYDHPIRRDSSQSNGTQNMESTH